MSIFVDYGEMYALFPEQISENHEMSAKMIHQKLVDDAKKYLEEMARNTTELIMN